jgi:hypothetical protein
MSSVYDRFRDAARRCPDLPFLCIPKGPARDYLAGGAEFRYGQALTIVEELATRYADAGYGVGHRVAIVLENRLSRSTRPSPSSTSMRSVSTASPGIGRIYTVAASRSATPRVPRASA